ncbi:hypothetical protein GCM10009863_39920 [Streptomyces axinellae]|uniref:Uncharacterized protein n=1 Tax=Streptomyces axinellae TaxID=552788 RepID=A0ABP6CJJ1_9ACTN
MPEEFVARLGQRGLAMDGLAQGEQPGPGGEQLQGGGGFDGMTDVCDIGGGHGFNGIVELSVKTFTR